MHWASPENLMASPLLVLPLTRKRCFLIFHPKGDPPIGQTGQEQTLQNRV
jgi:hypothetical protein